MMRFFSSAAGNAPAVPASLTNVLNLTPPYSATLTAVWNPGYNFGKGATSALTKNQFCATSTNICQAYTSPPESIVNGVQKQISNTAGPLSTGASGRIYWNVSITNNLGCTAVYASVSTAAIVP
jgi:hypothetical protein